MRRPMFVSALCALLILALVGCEEDPVEPIELTCDMSFSGAAIQGEWNLSAAGVREHCSDRRNRGDLSIESEVPFQITSMMIEDEDDASVSEADAFVHRIIERSGYDLTGTSLPARITFGGGTEGSCVSFTLTEDLSRGDELAYEFEGHITEVGVIEGNFSGSGPGDCTVRGTFMIDVR